MGLDIYVQRLRKQGTEDDYFIQLTGNDGKAIDEVPEYAKKLISKRTVEYYDWNKFKEQTGIDINDYEWCSECWDGKQYTMQVWPKAYEKKDIEDYIIGKNDNGDNIYDTDAYWAYENAHMLTIDMDTVPEYPVEVDVIYEDEVGYQRNGLNDKFYEDYEAEKIGYRVWDKKELERYKQDYCDTDEAKQNFQRNIIDKFVDGETCAEFSW